MKAIQFIATLATIVSFSLVNTTTPAGGEYKITHQLITSGGGRSVNGNYELNGTIGEPNAGTANGGIYSIQSGFQHASAAMADQILTSSFENP